jgi:UDP-GlcNAc:undecaprenyl-phosphate GlcNAc-1-phosphate transferase
MIGGLAIFTGILASTSLGSRYPHLLPLMTASGILVMVGFLDDRHDIRKRVRIVAQLMAAFIMVYWADMRIDTLGNLFGSGPILLGNLAVPFTFLATLGVINAVNMMDGADGLAGGLSLVSFVFLAVIAALGGRIEEMQILSVFIFCIAAFMLYNYRIPGRRQARVFMGDAGSTFLGFAICWFFISLSQGDGAVMAPVMAAWLLAVPLLDIFAVMIRRAASGRSPLSADREHIHHVLQRQGFPIAQVVNRLIFMAFLAATAATFLHWTLPAPERVLFFGFIVWIGLHVFTTQRRATSTQKRKSMAVK